jgi:hypothetical protein
VDGVKQTQSSHTGQTADTMLAWCLGTDGAAGPAYTANFDDVIYGTWTTASTDFITNAQVIGYAPGSDGTHNTAGGNTFIDGDTATTPNFTNSTTDAWTRVDDLPWSTTRRTTGNISAETHVAGDYMEFKPVPALDNLQKAYIVVAELAYSSVTALANLAATAVRNSAGTQVDIFGTINGTGADYSETTNFFKGVVVTEPAAGWTKSEIDAIRWRIGLPSGAGDVSPRPTWQGLLIQVAYPVGGPPRYDAPMIRPFQEMLRR